MTRQEFARWVAQRLKPLIRPYLEVYDPATYDDIKEIYTHCVAMSQVKDEDTPIIAPGGYEIPPLGSGKQTRVPTKSCCG